MATVIYATLNLDTWVVDFARAGHPYPLLIRADGPAIFLTDAGGPPLGTGGVGDYDQQRVTLGPAETLLLYTDGLIERRGRALSEGEAALVEAAAAAPDEPELMCRVDHPAADGGHRDRRRHRRARRAERSACTSGSRSRCRRRPSSWRPSGT